MVQNMTSKLNNVTIITPTKMASSVQHEESWNIQTSKGYELISIYR